MSAWTLSQSVDQLYASTWEHRHSDIKDNIFDQVPLIKHLRKRGNVKSIAGGRYIAWPIEYLANTTVTDIARGGTVTLTDDDILTEAHYQWRWIVGSIVRFRNDDQRNRSKAAVVRLADTKLNNLKKALMNSMETRLFTAQSGNYPDGLPDAIPTTSTNTYAEIDRSLAANAYWRNITTDFGSSASFAVYGIPKMRKMFNDCIFGDLSARPNLIVTTQQVAEWYEDEALELYTLRDRTGYDLGMDAPSFKGQPVMWAPSCTGGYMYFLNLDTLFLIIDQAYDFRMTSWKDIPNQPEDRAAQILLCYNLACNSPRKQGILYNVSTA